jgi:hypothetical protein
MIKKQIVAIICLSFLFAPGWAAQQAILQTDTRQQAWTKETANNSDLQTNINGKQDTSTNLDSINQDLGNTDSPAFNAMTLTGTNTLSVGTSSSNDGSILFKNGTNANAFTILTGATGAAIGWNLPTAAPGGTNYLLNVDANGDMGYTDPGSLGGAPEGTAVLSTGEVGAVKYLREDGDGTCSWQVPAGSGDVVGPASATDNAFPRYNLATGKLIQNGQTTEDDSGNVTVVGSMSAASYGSTKTPGVAGLLSLVEANSTDTFYVGIMGPANIAESFSHQFPNAQPAGSFYVWATPSGTGDPNSNKTSQATLYSIATASDLNTGTSTTSVPTPDALAGSNYGSENTGWTIHDSDVDTAVADGKQAFTIPAYMNGWNLVAVTGSIHDLNSATGGNTTFMVRRVRGATAVNMLSTGVTVAYTDYTASDGTIDTSNDDLQTGDRIFIDIDSVTTGAVQKGAYVTCVFRLP